MKSAELYDLAREVSKFRDDPLGFVLYCYPWGQGELADFRGAGCESERVFGIPGETSARAGL
jgi:hypothetical protein